MKVSPFAAIIAVALVALVTFAFGDYRGRKAQAASSPQQVAAYAPVPTPDPAPPPAPTPVRDAAAEAEIDRVVKEPIHLWAQGQYRKAGHLFDGQIGADFTSSANVSAHIVFGTTQLPFTNIKYGVDEIRFNGDTAEADYHINDAYGSGSIRRTFQLRRLSDGWKIYGASD